MVHYWTFSVLDNSENILNALENIEHCVKVEILVRPCPASFFEKDKYYVERIKRHTLFNIGTILKLKVGVPSYIHNKIMHKKDSEKEYRLLLAQYAFGVKLCTIEEINEVINRGLQ